MNVLTYKNPVATVQAKVTTLETTVANLPAPAQQNGGSGAMEPIYEYPAAPNPVIVAPDGTQEPLSQSQGTRLVNLGKTHTVGRTAGTVPPAYQASITAPLALLAGGNLSLRFAVPIATAGSIAVQLDGGPIMTTTGSGTAWASNDAGLVARTDSGWAWFEVNIPQRNDGPTAIKVTMPIGLVQLPCLYYPPVQTTIDPPSMVGMKLIDSVSGKQLNSTVELWRFTSIAEMQAFKYPREFSQAIVSGIRYEYRKGSYVLGFPGVVEMPLGRWIPANWTADPTWLRTQDYPNHYARTLKGETITSLSFDVCQRDDRSKSVTITVTDFITGCTVSGYYGIMGRFVDQLVVDRTLKLFIGVEISTGRVILNAMDLGLANPKFCWIRNIRLNGMPADFIDLGDLARSSFPKN